MIYICAFCEECHLNVNCKNLPGSAARMIVVKKKQLCFRCWRKPIVTECKSRGCCQNCKRKNHISICKNLRRNPELEPSQPEVVMFVPSRRRTKTDMLSITAFVSVSSDCRRSYFDWRRRATITHYQRACWRSSTSVWGHGFGECSSRHLQQMERSNVCIVSESKQNIPVIVPTIVAPISCTSDRRSHISAQIKAFPSRDNGNSFHISILVGADHYWYFKTIV